MAIELKDVQKQLKKILIEDLFVAIAEDQIKEDSSIATDVGLDSIGFVELATIIRERFDIVIADKDLTSGHFATIKSLSEYIISKVNVCVTS